MKEVLSYCGTEKVVYISSKELRNEFFELEENNIAGGFYIMTIDNKMVSIDFDRRGLWYKLRDDLLKSSDNDLFCLFITELSTSINSWINCFEVKIIRDFDEGMTKLNLEAVQLYNNILLQHTAFFRAIINNPSKDYIKHFKRLGFYENIWED